MAEAAIGRHVALHCIAEELGRDTPFQADAMAIINSRARAKRPGLAKRGEQCSGRLFKDARYI
jgi:hypothetical protein